MSRFDITKTISQTGESLKQLSVLNPLTIRKKNRKAKAIFALATVCFFWGTTWLASEQGVKFMPPLQLAGIRQFIGGTCYVIFFMLKRHRLPIAKEWITIFVLGMLNFLLSNGLSTWGVEYISAGLAAIIAAIFPLWLVVINVFVSKSKIPTLALMGFVIGFGGVCIIFFDHLHDFVNSGFRLGIVVSVIATWTWTFGTIYTKKQAVNFNPYYSLGLQMLISGILLLAFTRITHIAIPLSAIRWQPWAAIGYLVAFGSIVSFIAFLYALQNLPAEQASIYAYINPIVAVLLGWLIFSEKLTVFIGVGGLVALFGVYLVNKSYRAAGVNTNKAEIT